MAFLKKLAWVTFVLIILCSDISCNVSNDKQKKSTAKRLKEIATLINNDFIKIRKEAEKLASITSSLYEKEHIKETLKTVDPSIYSLHTNGVFYKPVDDGRSAVFVSGYFPVTEDIKQIVFFTEPLDPLLKGLVEKYPEIIQAYYNDRFCYNRIYPYFDVISQYEPKMNIPSFNFYYLADEAHNPGKKAVWVKEPYVDPAGRGWMVSAIVPVYVNGNIEGVPGLDITIETITNRYLDEENEDLAILDAAAMVVSIQEPLSNLFSLPPLEKHKYLETIKMDTFRADDFNLLHSKNRDVRKMANRIFKENRKEIILSKGAEKYFILVEDIPDLDWKLLAVLR